MKRTYLLSGTYLLSLSAVLILFSSMFSTNGRNMLFVFAAVVAAIVGIVCGGIALFEKEPENSKPGNDETEDGKPNE